MSCWCDNGYSFLAGRPPLEMNGLKCVSMAHQSPEWATINRQTKYSNLSFHVTREFFFSTSLHQQTTNVWRVTSIIVILRTPRSLNQQSLRWFFTKIPTGGAKKPRDRIDWCELERDLNRNWNGKQLIFSVGNNKPQMDRGNRWPARDDLSLGKQQHSSSSLNWVRKLTLKSSVVIVR